MKYILLVDDSEVILNIVIQTLKINNYNDILTAKDGVEGLEIAKKYTGQISLYIFDVNMPKMDGLTLLSEVRKIDKATPIIMLTTETDKEKIMNAKNIGATGWVVKPFEGDKFIKIVDMYLKN
jgi:two-component system chemotaxis response regulator CheY